MTKKNSNTVNVNTVKTGLDYILDCEGQKIQVFLKNLFLWNNTCECIDLDSEKEYIVNIGELSFN